MTPTPQQEAVYDAVSDGTSHIAVTAVAGAGKSTTAVEAAKRVAGKCAFVAFNKSIATDLGRKLNGSAKACTMHSLGFATVRKNRPVAGEVDEYKYQTLLERLRPAWHRDHPTKILCKMPDAKAAATLRVADMCRVTLLDPAVSGNVEWLDERYGLDIPVGGEDDVRKAASDLLALGASHPTIDFSDMVWLPARLGYDAEQFDVLMMDEAQDTNAAMASLARSATRNGRLMVVGDERQAINGFNGADPAAMPNLIDDLGETGLGIVERPLTVTFRCPVSHVDLARRIVNHIEPAKNAIPGVVSVMERAALVKYVKPGDLVIARRNAPLVPITLELIGAGIPSVLLGRDFAGGLASLVDKLNPSTVADAAVKLKEWEHQQVARLERKRASESMLNAIYDKVECLMTLLEKVETVSELRSMLRRMFADTADHGKVVRLSSIHKAKGGEADRVFIADTQCLPMVNKSTRPWEYDQEMNLAYVAVTRAKQSLFFLDSMPAVFGGSAALTRGTVIV